MLRSLALVTIAGCVAALSAPAAAGDAAQTLEELRRQFASVRDDELKVMRGGFAGLAFSVFFNGTVDNLGNQSGTLDVSTSPNLDAPAPTVTVTDTQVQIQTVIGNFQGATGIFQIADVPGNFNVVNNNLFVQLAIFEVTNAADIPALQSLLTGGFGN